MQVKIKLEPLEMSNSSWDNKSFWAEGDPDVIRRLLSDVKTQTVFKVSSEDPDAPKLI